MKGGEEMKGGEKGGNEGRVGKACSSRSGGLRYEGFLFVRYTVVHETHYYFNQLIDKYIYLS